MVPPLLGVCTEYALSSYPFASDHHHRSLHQVGGRRYGLQHSFGWGHNHIIVVVDYFTKWAEDIPIIKAKGETITHFVFNQIITRFGIPRELVTDHGRHFQNKMMEEFSSKLGYNQENSSSYYP